VLVDGKLQPLTVKVGDRVVYKKYSTTEFKFEEEEYLVIAEKDILAIVE
jgi:chaperonin GroES